MDTLRIRIPYNIKDKSKLKRFFNKKLDKQLSGKFHRGSRSRFIISNYFNWRCNLGTKYVTILGSLATASKGSNIYNIDFEDMVKELNELQRVFCLDLSDAIVLRIDIGYNIIVNQPLFRYLNLLKCPEHLKHWSIEGESFRYFGKSEELKGYSKIQQLKDERLHLPLQYKKINMLRLELTLDKIEMFRRSGIGRLGFSDLFNENTYNQLIALWFNSFLRCLKNNIYQPAELGKRGLKGWRNFIMKSYLMTKEGQDFTKMYLQDSETLPCHRIKIKEYIEDLNMEKYLPNRLEDELRSKLIKIYCDYSSDQYEMYKDFSSQADNGNILV